jgi:hypothetical protein
VVIGWCGDPMEVIVFIPATHVQTANGDTIYSQQE